MNWRNDTDGEVAMNELDQVMQLQDILLAGHRIHCWMGGRKTQFPQLVLQPASCTSSVIPDRCSGLRPLFLSFLYIHTSIC